MLVLEFLEEAVLEEVEVEEEQQQKQETQWQACCAVWLPPPC